MSTCEELLDAPNIVFVMRTWIFILFLFCKHFFRVVDSVVSMLITPTHPAASAHVAIGEGLYPGQSWGWAEWTVAMPSSVPITMPSSMTDGPQSGRVGSRYFSSCSSLIG